MKRHLLLLLLFLTLFSIGLLIQNYPADAATNRGRTVQKAMLPEELKNIAIRDYFIGFAGKEIGVIRTVAGHVVVARGDMSQAYYAAPGDKLFEKDVVFTLKSSRCRFRLNGEDVVTMGENAKVGIKSFIDNRTAKTKSATFNMARGKAMYYSLRLFKYNKGSTMNVETPTAVCGVRGTKFGVEVIELEGKPTASLPIIVADVSDTGFRQLAQANQPNYQTNFYCFEGQIQVTSMATGQSTTLGQGQGVNTGGTGLGGSFTTPPGVAQGFQAGTEGSTPGDTGGAGGTGTGNGTGTGTGAGTGTIDTSGITQNQTTNNIPAPTRTTTATGRYGFTSTMLKGYVYSEAGSYWAYDAHLMTPMMDFSSPVIVGVDPFGGSYASIFADGSSSYLDPTITSVSNSSGASLSFSPTAVSHTELGHTDYTEWGIWTLDLPMTNGTSYNFIDHKGWYVNGTNTTDAQMAALKAGSVTGIYSGVAYGTYVLKTLADSPVTLSGTFSANVDFASPQISNFNLNVTGGGKTVTVTGATGVFVGNTSQFVVAGGNPTITGAGGATTHISFGSVYGNTGQAVGGVWGVNSPAAAATGIFHGTK